MSDDLPTQNAETYLGDGLGGGMMANNRDISGYTAALRYVLRYNPGPAVSHQNLKRRLDDTIQRLRDDPRILSSKTLGFLIIRNGEEDFEVWVDPDLWKEREPV